MNFAIIKTGGKEYKVKVGDTLKIERIKTLPKKLDFIDLLYGKKVQALTIGEGKLEKVRVLKQQAKKRYKRIIGHRQKYLEIKIEKID